MTVVVLMGVAGSGKTTVGETLARHLGWEWQEGDALHPLANVAKMSAGTELTDQDRWPWLAAIAAVIDSWRAQGRKVVFTNGCYDILHPGHIRLLERARSLGDVLILALNTDASVARLKGPSRPLIGEDERSRMALALEAVDAVTFFDENTPRELIAEVLPDILVKGADWAHFVAGREEVEAAGGKVMLLALEPGFSTTNIEKELLARIPAVSPSTL